MDNGAGLLADNQGFKIPTTRLIIRIVVRIFLLGKKISIGF